MCVDNSFFIIIVLLRLNICVPVDLPEAEVNITERSRSPVNSAPFIAISPRFDVEEYSTCPSIDFWEMGGRGGGCSSALFACNGGFNGFLFLNLPRREPMGVFAKF